MADVLFIALMVGFFGLAVLLVRACDRIIGVEDTVVLGRTTDEDQLDELAA